jgi:hypothetical protein
VGPHLRDRRTNGAGFGTTNAAFPPADLSFCCGPSNRGVSIWNDLIYMTTLDAHHCARSA